MRNNGVGLQLCATRDFHLCLDEILLIAPSRILLREIQLKWIGDDASSELDRMKIDCIRGHGALLPPQCYSLSGAGPLPG